MSDKELDPIDEALKGLLNTPHGKTFLWFMLDITDIHSEAMSETPEKTAYNLGRQSVGQDLVRAIEIADPQGYPKLLLSKEVD